MLFYDVNNYAQIFGMVECTLYLFELTGQSASQAKRLIDQPPARQFIVDIIAIIIFFGAALCQQ